MQKKLEAMLDRLDNVKKYQGSFRARCPAHEGREALKITLKGERILIHCFAGCGGAEVMAALGMSLSDLYPEPLGHHTPPTPKAVSVKRAAAELSGEALIILIAASDVRAGVALSDADMKRVSLAAERIHRAQEVLRKVELC